MKKTAQILFTGVFLLVLAWFPAATLFSGSETYSFFENRNLAPLPEPERENILSGAYFSEFEEYYVDHIAFRDGMIAAYTFFNVHIADKVMVNDIVITENALLPYQPERAADPEAIALSAAEMAKKYENLSAFTAANGGVFLYVGVPEQSSMLRDSYPSYMNNNGAYLDAVEEAFFQALDAAGVQSLNMRPVYEQSGDFERYYSVTDHHFNMQGAYVCYRSILEAGAALGVAADPLEEEELIYEELPNPYYGSRGRILYNVIRTPDRLGIYRLKDPLPYIRRDNGEEVDQIFFIPEDPKEKITYNVYMGGDVAETVIETGREELPDVLVFGDSFTNPVETLLYASFNRTVAVDLRHNTEKTIYEYIEEYQPDLVLCIRDDTAYLSTDGNGGF